MFKIKIFIILAATAFMFSTAFAEDTIDIAAIYAMSGMAAEGQVTVIQGVRHAVNEINEQGGVLGRKINLLVLDNLSTPLGSNVAAERAVKEGVTAIVGAS